MKVLRSREWDKEDNDTELDIDGCKESESERGT
jgi:hypothetical protein